MRQKHLESALSSIQREFPDPDVTLEQYPTSPQLAAAVALCAQEHGDLGPNISSALDLGCGTGILAIAAALLETQYVWALDCDAAALEVAESNAEELEVDDVIDFIQVQVKGVGGGVSAGSQQEGSKGGKAVRNKGGGRGSGKRGRGGGRGQGGRGRQQSSYQSQHQRASTIEARNLILSDDDGIPLQSKCVDTVLTNPPFGTKANNAGMDLRFLRAATRLARQAVYSFHKTSTRDFLIKQVQQEWGMQVKVVAEMKFDLPQTYKFHKQSNVDIAVDLIRVDVRTSTMATTSPSSSVPPPMTEATQTTLRQTTGEDELIEQQEEHASAVDDDDDDNNNE